MRRLVLSVIMAAASYLTVGTPAVATTNETTNTSKEVSQVIKNMTTAFLPPHPIPPGVTAEDMAKWNKVATCETGGRWYSQGPIYSGGLGIRNDVWIEYGGRQFGPTAGYATPQQQVYIAKKINSNGYVPDQYGCEGAW